MAKFRVTCCNLLTGKLIILFVLNGLFNIWLDSLKVLIEHFMKLIQIPAAFNSNRLLNFLLLRRRKSVPTDFVFVRISSCDLLEIGVQAIDYILLHCDPFSSIGKRRM